MIQLAHETKLGRYYVGESSQVITKLMPELQDSVQLILTSPPFPLNKKKSYGNLKGNHYKEWFTGLAKPFSKVITKDGSIVIELGNSWEEGRPIQSLLYLEALLAFVNSPNTGLRLCQQFISHNPARLPSPAQWVTVERIRMIDSYTNLWWMAKSDFPKADNRKVLRPYSKSMKSLLKRNKFNSGKRPSGHTISSTGFLKDNGGSIMPNVIELEAIENGKDIRLPNAFSISNTKSNDFFGKKCRELNITPHPARMAAELVIFFILFLTDPGDLILDPFGGSNTTGFIAELLGRRWISIDISDKYVEQSKIRFMDPLLEQAPLEG